MEAVLEKKKDEKRRIAAEMQAEKAAEISYRQLLDSLTEESLIKLK